MTFGRAVTTCFKKYAIFSGRAPRSEFWYFKLFFVLVVFLASFSAHILAGTSELRELAVPLVALLLFMPNLAVTVRRLHDMDKSGWFVLLNFIPLVGEIILMIMALGKSDEGANRYGTLDED